MFRPLSLYIGLRYTRAKRRNHFISFISLVSMLGIALGIMVIITVLSVMNGFDDEIHNRIFSLARQVMVTNPEHKITAWQQLQKQITYNPDVVETAPFVLGQAMLSNAGVVQGVMVSGIIPEEEAKISTMQNLMTQGSMAELKSGGFGVVIGQEIAKQLGVGVGDKVILIAPQAAMTPLGVEPRVKRLTVVGVFHVGEGFGYDASSAYINFYDAQKIYQVNGATGINIKITDLYRAPLVSAALSEKLGPDYNVSDWTDQFGTFFRAIKMEKTTMFVVLLFIIAVAAFNLVSSLVMTVTDKESDIAILRTLGASPKTIMTIFIVQGGIVGGFGTLLGIISGILMAVNAPELVKILEHVFHTHFISAAIYFVDYLPSKLQWSDIWRIGVASLVMSLGATIYPAWRASKIQPAEALRYD